MATLLYHWNFTGSNNLSLNEAIYDSEANLIAKVKEEVLIVVQVSQEVRMVYF